MFGDKGKGDKVQGDKVLGDKVDGDKVLGNKLLIEKIDVHLPQPEPKRGTRGFWEQPMEDFLGRVTESKDLLAMVEREKKVILVQGLGGVGKTYLANRLVNQTLERWDWVFWFNCQGRSLNETLFHEDRYPWEAEGDSLEEVAQHHYRQMEALPGKKLLVLDRMDQDKVVESLRGRFTSFSLLLTSRCAGQFNFLTPYQLEMLNPQDARELFVLHAKRKDLGEEDWTRLQSITGRHALLLKLVGVAWRDTGLTLGQILDKLQAHRLDDPRLNAVSGQQNQIMEQVKILYQVQDLPPQDLFTLKQLACLPLEPYTSVQLQEFFLFVPETEEEEEEGLKAKVEEIKGLLVILESPEGRQVLEVMTWEELQGLVNQVDSWGKEEANQQLEPDREAEEGDKQALIQRLEQKVTGQLQQLQEKLAQLSANQQQALEADQAALLASLHRLCHLGWLSRQQQGAFQLHQMVREVVLAQDPPQAEEMERLLLYLISAVELEPTDNQFSKAGHLPLAQEALGVIQGASEPLLDLWQRTSRLLGEVGEEQASLEMNEQSLPRLREFFGPQSRQVAACLTNLADSFRKARDWERAEEAAQEALAIWQEQGDDFLLIQTYNVLGGIFQDQKDIKAAEGAFQKALELLESEQAKLLKERNFASWATRASQIHNNLGSLFSAQGKHRDALPEFQDAFQLLKKRLSGPHPSVAQILTNISSCHAKLQEGLEAWVAAGEALRNFKGSDVPPEHPDFQSLIFYLLDLDQAFPQDRPPELESLIKKLREKLGPLWEEIKNQLPPPNKPA